MFVSWLVGHYNTMKPSVVGHYNTMKPSVVGHYNTMKLSVVGHYNTMKPSVVFTFSWLVQLWNKQFLNSVRFVIPTFEVKHSNLKGRYKLNMYRVLNFNYVLK